MAERISSSLQRIAALESDMSESTLPALTCAMERKPLMADKPVLADRIREAREYLGFTVEQVSTAFGWDEDCLMNLEDGLRAPTPLELELLGALYRRPVAWLQGETTWQPDEGMLRLTEHLCEHDREAIFDFAEFLSGAGQPAKPVRRQPDA